MTLNKKKKGLLFCIFLYFLSKNYEAMLKYLSEA